MKKLFGSDVRSPFDDCPSIVTIGMFDGVHIGHQKVIAQTVAAAKEHSAKAIAVTFDIHPRKLLSSGPDMICSLEHRLVLLEKYGLDAAIVLPFTHELASVSAHNFCQSFLLDSFNAIGVVLGFNATFGHKGQGNGDFIRTSGLPLWCEVVDPVVVDGRKVSSTEIRACVKNGELEAASLMLGRESSVLGTVMHGKKIGRTIGFPTLNIDPHHELHPPRGVYATMARCGDTWWKSITNIGHRPTVDSKCVDDIYIETHLFNFSGNLYDQRVEVFFHEKLRDEITFDSLDKLRQQILLDVEIATNVLGRA